MKRTVNKRGNPGTMMYQGRPDRTKAPLIKQSNDSPQPKPVESKVITKPVKELPPIINVVDTPIYESKEEPKINPSGYIKRRRN